MSNVTSPQKLPSPNVRIVFIVFKCVFCFIVRIYANGCVIIYNVFFNPSKTPTKLFCSKPGLLYHLHNLDHKIRRKRFGSYKWSKAVLFCSSISAINVQLSILIILAKTVDKFVFINWGWLYET